MKKALFLIPLLFIICGFNIHGNVQIGYIKQVDAIETQINIMYNPLEWLEIYGGFLVLAEYGGKYGFFPYRDTYSIGTKINLFKNLYIDLYHHCTHPVYSHEKQFFEKFRGGNKTKITVGLEW